MRIVSSEAINAITNQVDYRYGARLTVYKSRAYFNAFTGTSDLIDERKASGHIGIALSETTMPFAPTINDVKISPITVTVWITSNYEIGITFDGATTTMVLKDSGTHANIGVAPNTKMGLWADDASNTYTLFYSDTNEAWQTRIIDPELLLAENEECVSAVESYNAVAGPGAIFPVSSTEAVIYDIYEGSIRVSFIAYDKSIRVSSHRFINPTLPHDPATQDEVLCLLYKGGAVKVSGSVFTYFTNYKGAVIGMKYVFSNNNKDGVWSDIFTAIPEDLCNFDINNVFSVDNRIFICGRFYRQEQFVSGTIYTELVWSDDGITFTLNRRTLCSLMSYFFYANYCDGELTFSSSGRYYRTTAPYYIIGEDAPNTILALGSSISGNINGELSVNLAAGQEEYFDNAYIDTGAYAKMEIGVATTAGVEWIKYQDLVISGIGKNLKDGVRGHTLNLQTDGIWHTSNMSHPFYMEWQGKQGIFDDCTTMDHLVHASVGENPKWSLCVDFWEADGKAPEVATHAGNTRTEHYTADLLTKFSAYPVFGDDANYTVKIYGWSRAGVPDTNPNTVDNTPVGTLNDKFYLLMEHQSPTGTKTIVTTESWGTLTSTYGRPPQTHFQVHDGSNPVTFSVPNPGAGYKITKLGVAVKSDTGNTTYYLERIEIPAIACEPISLETDTAAFQQSELMGEKTLGLTGPITVNFYQTGLISQDDPDILVGFYEPQHTAVFASPKTMPALNNLFYTATDLKAISDEVGGYGVVITYNADNVIHQTYDEGTNHTEFNFVIVDMEGKIKVNADGNYSLSNGSCAGFNGTYNGYNNFYRRNTDMWIGTTHHLQYGIDTSYASQKEIALTKGEYDFKVRYEYQASTGQGQPDWLGAALALAIDFRYRSGFLGINPGETNGGITVIDTNANQPIGSFINTKKSVPQLLFSDKPYSTFNFEEVTRVMFTGQYSKVGLVGLATDKRNFVAGILQTGKAYIAKYRDGVETILSQVTDSSILENTKYDMRFWHRDGKFGIEYRTGDSTASGWGPREGQLAYSWRLVDGAMTMSDDIMHVGVFSFIDPPRFRTTGFRSSLDLIPVLPLDIDPNEGNSDFVNDFPTSGQVDVGGKKYTYQGKSVYYNTNPPIRGPFQLRVLTDYADPYNKSFDGAFTFQASKGLECTIFEWHTSGDNRTWGANAIIASSAGYCWLNDQTQWDPWVRTAGEKVKLRNRARFYSTSIPNYYPAGTEKIYFTNGLTGVAPVTASAGEAMHQHGSYVFLDQDDKITIYGFYAASGENSQDIQSLLNLFCRLSGTEPTFLGDTVIESITKANGESINL